MARPAGNGFSWAEDGGAFVTTPVQSLVDLGYAPGSPAEPLTLNDGLRQLGLWSQYLAGISPSANVLVVDEVRSRDPAWVDTVSGSRLALGANVTLSSEAGSLTALASGLLLLASAAGDVSLSSPTGQVRLSGDDGILMLTDTLLAPQGASVGLSWRGHLYGERPTPSGGATAYPTVTYDLSPGLGRWRPRLSPNPNILFQSTAASNGVDLRHQSSSGAQQQQWRVGLPPMPHFSRSAEMTLSDVEVDVGFGSDTTASSTVTATLYRYDGTSGTMTVVASGSVSGTGAGASSDTIALVSSGHTVVEDEGTNYVLDVLVEVEDAGADFVISIDAARMTLAKTGIE